MNGTETLLPDLQRLVQDLKADLRERLREYPELDAELKAHAYAPMEKGGRTAQAYESGATTTWSRERWPGSWPASSSATWRTTT